MLGGNAPRGENSFPREVQLPAKPEQEGEFTRMMASPLARAGLGTDSFSPPEQTAGKPKDPGEFTRMMESSRALEPEVPRASAPPRSAYTGGEAMHAPLAPSEFTQMFKAPAKEPAPAKKPPEAKAPRVIPRKRKKKAYWMWIFVGSGVVLIIALILVFSFRD
jgi:hypothetical protein